MGPYKSQLIVWGSKTNPDPFIQNELSSLVITQALFTAMKHSRPPCSWCFFPVFLLRSTLQWYSQVILNLIHSRASLEILCSDKKKHTSAATTKKDFGQKQVQVDPQWWNNSHYSIHCTILHKSDIYISVYSISW